MERSRPLWRPLIQSLSATPSPPTPNQTSWICTQCRHTLRRKPVPTTPVPPQPSPRRWHSSSTNPADLDPNFKSIVDNPPTLIRAGRRHNKAGLAFLAAIPLTAFLLGCWQVQRLGWKTDLIARFEDRLVRDPLPLPPQIDPDAVAQFDYRRVYARGTFRHDREMLIGPRLHDGEDGYMVVTPLERGPQQFGGSAPGNTTVLVCRGWIPKEKAAQAARAEGLPRGEVVVQGLLREPWRKNMFTPANRPAENAWFFPDVAEMAAHSGSQAVWVEETMRPDLLESYRRAEKGIPIGRPPEVNLRNNHVQYIFTWFSLSLATSIMLWMVVKKPQTRGSARVRRNTGW